MGVAALLQTIIDHYGPLYSHPPPSLLSNFSWPNLYMYVCVGGQMVSYHCTQLAAVAIQAPNFYTSNQLLYKHPTTIQTPNHHTNTHLLYKNPTTMQAPNCYTSTQLLHKQPTTIQAPNYYTSTQLLYKHPTTIQSPYYYSFNLRL